MASRLRRALVLIDQGPPRAGVGDISVAVDAALRTVERKDSCALRNRIAACVFDLRSGNAAIGDTFEAGSTNIAFEDSTELLMIDLDGNGVFEAGSDFSIRLVGVINVTYVGDGSSTLALGFPS